MMSNRKIAEEELTDPALTALLQDTFAHDPSLADAPGRTERIMRFVLSAPRPTPWVGWSLLGWTAGATATAAALLLLMFHATQLPLIESPTFATAPAQVAIPTAVPATKSPEQSLDIAARLPQPAVRNESAWEWKSPTTTVAVHPSSPWMKPDEINTPPETLDGRVDVAEDTTVRTASALNSAGSAAYAAGDYETAYQAYAESYETLPTPDTILHTGQALQRLAQDELTPEG